MKKTTVLLLVLSAVFLTGCKELTRSNPTDPDGSAYIGITYKGEAWYPMDTDIRALAVASGVVTLGAYNPVDGDCLMRLGTGSTYTKTGSTGDTPGYFRAIQDICADSAGNIYVVDYKDVVQCVSPADVFTSWPLGHTADIDKLSVECLNDIIYVSNGADRTVISYTTSGTQVDAVTLSFTAYGDFVPGRIWSSASHLYVVNASDLSEVAQFTTALVQSAVYDFQTQVMDGCVEGTQMELCAQQAVYKAGDDLSLTMTWGNYGTGPGRILNGKLVAYDAAQKYVYILDGGTLKYFGE
ncbi:MAG: hypothetical protein LLG37_10625 [Spirochaetia bacterium]|nr:hypothetical protein [Spirochaetia bacterium]